MSVHTIKTRTFLAAVQPRRAVIVAREDRDVTEIWMLPVQPVCSEGFSAPLHSLLSAVKDKVHKAQLYTLPRQVLA